jgi:hypothetical protein
VKHNSAYNSICNDRLNITLYNVYEHVTEDLEGRSVNEIIDKGVSAIIKDKCECTTVSLLIVDAKAKIHGIHMNMQKPMNAKAS